MSKILSSGATKERESMSPAPSILAWEPRVVSKQLGSRSHFLGGLKAETQVSKESKGVGELPLFG